jgi:hypothetical protein
LAIPLRHHACALTTTGSSRRKLVCARSFVGLAVAAQEGDPFLPPFVRRRVVVADC